MILNINLAEWEWDIVDAEAAACGMTRQEMLRELIRDGLEHEVRDMNPVFQTGDSQWKSH